MYRIEMRGKFEVEKFSDNRLHKPKASFIHKTNMTDQLVIPRHDS
jgi:hypothetical protein